MCGTDGMPLLCSASRASLPCTISFHRAGTAETDLLVVMGKDPRIFRLFALRLGRFP